MNLDIAVFYFLNHDLGWDGIAPFMRFLSSFRAFLPLVVLAVLWMLVRGGWKGRMTVLLLLITVSLSDLTSVRLVKPAFHRARPCWPASGLTDVKTHGAYCPRNASFPSSHATNTATATAVLVGSYPVLAAPMVLVMVFVGWSRVYFGTHYPSDILGGWVMGALLGGGGAWGLRRWEARRRVRNPRP